MFQTDDVRISKVKELLPPVAVLEKFPATETASSTTFRSREAISKILNGDDDRLLVIVGPCSIHDPEAAIEYGKRLKVLRDELGDRLEVVMRVYFEKPRTTVGWKGLINDPYLNDTFKINDGLRMGRKLLLDLTDLGLPTASEFLDMITPQYVADLISWGAIGARTTESQVHRELASGISCPVGFKNGTDGNIKIASDAIRSASASHHFLSVTKYGHSAIVETAGNPDCHIILRGGKEPNYSAEHVGAIKSELEASGLPQKVMIDFSHANSSKQYQRQMLVSEDVAGQISAGEDAIFGVMIESHLVEGRQDLVDGQAPTYGQSITDACIGWEDTEKVLRQLADAVEARRNK
ncbi:phospho-2-dehydro-3-deoxyheptonate aldolase [Vibrio coralliilyticus]|jgi:3-deoxy-7-phosphoheptulonate synthase|uniref:Phospho-2-dehydro-3-deoxyheptonate aldolase n=1 Tax=Vibrio coralliilyticus TaxID=190893 RepID=A0A0A0SY19_9VIBR|nr:MULTISPECIES: 3-deoxy-7-phosphoheptulonate synthase AroG [Vibrio]AIW21868.1 phospho-2-dehydro-3-deoxyheptonate aldolase [Vibrio coralliilyticus]ANW26319.1 3-deoxy-7-phosphoheptulonate synthase [Vibrio coralliilyticus]ARC93762.1 3-deoxy-7-phosphoheptulonate synthase [Vibrio coralliilyticus]EEX33042.1 2-keto-3-deoxy-D-arabino-heptulosonate-7-phosphate synthase I alpha [Vibrio coralliilyticus ATCC BAA-450]ERB63345.1 phospho-2-dehydro-3-deoxyheptonate aldolase [Vibrio coralliilyticus OCN008]